MSKYSHRHKKYDTTIMQTATVENIIDSLALGIKHNNLREVCQFLTDERIKALAKVDRRKANSVDKKIKRLKELGYKIPKEVTNALAIRASKDS